MRELLQAYLEELIAITHKEDYESEESFLNLPFDPEIKKDVDKAIDTANIKISNLKHVIVLGIGGSSQGAKAIYDALKKEKTLAQMHFLDQIEPDIIDNVARQVSNCNSSEVAIVTISKSGTTMETVINYELFKSALLPNRNFPQFTIMGKGAPKAFDGIFLQIPDTVGGRFSVFSAVGLLPLTLAGINTSDLMEGARKATETCLRIEDNKTLKETIKIFEAYLDGKEIYNTFVFSKELLTLAEWQKQLIGESLGKEGKGILPIISQGSKDLHSLQQYFVGGRQNVQHEVISIKGRNKFQDAIENAVLEIYADKNIPYRETLLKNLNEFSLGEYMQTKFFETLFLAKLMEVSPFGQPDVEGYKKRIRSYK